MGGDKEGTDFPATIGTSPAVAADSGAVNRGARWVPLLGKAGPGQCGAKLSPLVRVREACRPNRGRDGEVWL